MDFCCIPGYSLYLRLIFGILEISAFKMQEHKLLSILFLGKRIITDDWDNF